MIYGILSTKNSQLGKDKIMKKRLLAWLLTTILVVSMMTPTAFATYTGGEPQQTEVGEFSAEMSIDDLQNGVTVIIEDTGDGNYLARQLSPEEAFALESGRISIKVEATFHCGLKYDKNTHKGYLHWTATGDKLTRVQANVFCRETTILFPESFFDGDIDGYSDLRGQYNSAYGATGSFEIPSNIKKVKVGWDNAYVTTLEDGKMSMSNASETITLSKLPHTNVY